MSHRTSDSGGLFPRETLPFPGQRLVEGAAVGHLGESVDARQAFQSDVGPPQSRFRPLAQGDVLELDDDPRRAVQGHQGRGGHQEVFGLSTVVAALDIVFVKGWMPVGGRQGADTLAADAAAQQVHEAPALHLVLRFADKLKHGLIGPKDDAVLAHHPGGVGAGGKNLLQFHAQHFGGQQFFVGRRRRKENPCISPPVSRQRFSPRAWTCPTACSLPAKI